VSEEQDFSQLSSRLRTDGARAREGTAGLSISAERMGQEDMGRGPNDFRAADKLGGATARHSSFGPFRRRKEKADKGWREGTTGGGERRKRGGEIGCAGGKGTESPAAGDRTFEDIRTRARVRGLPSSFSGFPTSTRPSNGIEAIEKTQELLPESC